ncbi:MAG: VOC family protein [Hyphomicrobiales bacterium]
MKLLHAMLRVRDPEATLRFLRVLGIRETRRFDQPAGRFTLIYCSDGRTPFEIELTHNWDREDNYATGDAFGHIAVGVGDIYAACEELMGLGATVARPPRDGAMAFVKTPDGISIELLNMGASGPVPAKWLAMPNTGTW